MDTRELPHDLEAGSLRMEEAGGKLYVYTCHEMYADSDGINHQANMLFTITDKIGRAVQQECRDRSRMPSSA